MRLRAIAALCTAFFLTSAVAWASPFVGRNGFMIEPPAGWVSQAQQGDSQYEWKETDKSDDAAIIRVGDYDNFNASTIDKSLDLLQDYVHYASNWALVSRGSTTIGGRPAGYLEDSWQEDGFKWRSIETLIPGNGTTYGISFLAPDSEFERLVSTFKAVTASFRVINKVGRTPGDGSRIDTRYGCSLVVPRGWTLRDEGTDDGIWVLRKETSLGLSVIPLPLVKTVDRLYADRQSFVQAIVAKSGGMKVTKEDICITSGRHAFEVVGVYPAKRGQPELYFRSLLIPKNDVDWYAFICSGKRNSTTITAIAGILQSVRWDSQ